MAGYKAPALTHQHEIVSLEQQHRSPSLLLPKAGTAQQRHESSQFLLGADDGRKEERGRDAVILRTKTTKQKYFSGRTVSLRFLTVCVGVILVVNIGMLAYAIQKGKAGDGSPLLAVGACEYIKKLDIVIHVGINVLGILILAGVGGFLTLLTSPTRQHLNAAHRVGQSLDIGIPSLRNFGYMGARRRLLWIALFLLSWPLHILYNSIIYVLQNSFAFYWMVVTPDFLTGNDYNATWLPTSCNAPDSDVFPANLQKVVDMHSSPPSYTKLGTLDCLSTYSNLYPTDYSDVIMVTSDSNRTNSLLAWDQSINFNTLAWLCSPPVSCGLDESEYQNINLQCDFTRLEKNPSAWTNFGHTIEYCLAQPEAESGCALTLDKTLTITLIIFNGLVLLIMLYCLIFFWRELKHSLGCFGDVISSYLKLEDDSTHGMCLADKQRASTFWRTRGQPMTLDQRKRRWYHALSRSRLYTILSILGVGFLACTICLGYLLYIMKADRHLSVSPGALWHYGFGNAGGQINSGLLANLDYSPTGLALLSNIPQLLLSVITLFTNAALAETTQAAAYAGFGSRRKTLRVSAPIGPQRGTYLLGAPWRYAVPALALTSALHWAISQSLAPIIVSSASTNPADPMLVFTTNDLAFSPLAVVASFVLAAALVAATLVLGLKSLPPIVPLASSSSLALSAAVHPGPAAADADADDEPLAEYMPVMWGVTGYGVSRDGVGHCSFAPARTLLRPDVSRMYM